jgi:hypothetical protein
MPHSNQNTQANIECYHKALKCWFSLKTKGLRGHRIDWLMWRLTMTMARHYMHQVDMNKQGFIKNKVMVRHVVASVDKTNRTLMWSHIPLKGMMTMFDGCEANTIPVLLTRSMPLSPSMQVALLNGHCKASFANIKLLFYWLISTSQRKYCGMYYGTHDGGLKCMFAEPAYL